MTPPLKDSTQSNIRNPHSFQLKNWKFRLFIYFFVFPQKNFVRGGTSYNFIAKLNKQKTLFAKSNVNILERW